MRLDPSPLFVLFEIGVLTLFAVCLRQAARVGPAAVWQLLAGVLFGLLLEWMTLRQLQAYQYGRFLLMLGDLPLLIGVGWGVILYSVRVFADATSLPEWARPVLEGLLALNIDLGMDAIAVRLGMWSWGLGLQAQYFGVPYANFWAWFWVALTFSVGLRAFARPVTWAGRWLGPMAAVGFGLVNLAAMNTLLAMGVPAASYLPTIGLMLGMAAGLVIWLRPRFSLLPVDPVTFWVPFGFHLFFLTAGLLTGAVLQPPALLLIGLLMAGVALYLHRRSFWAVHMRAAASSRGGPP